MGYLELEWPIVLSYLAFRRTVLMSPEASSSDWFGRGLLVRGGWGLRGPMMLTLPEIFKDFGTFPKIPWEGLQYRPVSKTALKLRSVLRKVQAIL